MGTAHERRRRRKAAGPGRPPSCGPVGRAAAAGIGPGPAGGGAAIRQEAAQALTAREGGAAVDRKTEAGDQEKTAVGIAYRAKTEGEPPQPQLGMVPSSFRSLQRWGAPIRRALARFGHQEEPPLTGPHPVTRGASSREAHFGMKGIVRGRWNG